MLISLGVGISLLKIAFSIVLTLDTALRIRLLNVRFINWILVLAQGIDLRSVLFPRYLRLSGKKISLRSVF
jgi:hypothetical protein